VADLHGPNINSEPDRPAISARNARYGLVLFFVYLLFYGSYVLANVFAGEQMERTPLAGVNVAILSGFGLILAAFVLALVYGWLCRAAGEPTDQLPGDKAAGR